MNIINCVQAQIHYLQENECKVVHSEYSTYMCIGVEKYKKTALFIVARESGGGS